MGLISRLGKQVVKGVIGGDANNAGDALVSLERARNEYDINKARKASEFIDGIIRYTKINIDSIEEQINNLVAECNSLKQEVLRKGILGGADRVFITRKNRDLILSAQTKVSYLYLSKDYFGALSMSLSGTELSKIQMSLVKEFTPFFSGVQVLNIDPNAESVAESLKTVKDQFMVAFRGASSKGFSFESYLADYYQKDIVNLVIPDMEPSMKTLIKAIQLEEASNKAQIQTEDEPITISTTGSTEIECSNCHNMFDRNSKFCPYCGAKNTLNRPAFCDECGSPIKPGTKFCSNCGKRIEG